MSRISIHLHGLHKKLGANQALNGASTVFSEGRLHGLIGPDGAGKTTLLRTLVGLLKPNAGQVEYRLDDSPVPLERIRASIAYMPQQQSLYPDLSIREHLEFFRDLYQIAHAEFADRSTELLQITRLGAFQDRLASQLSGGMYKKLGLMCALLQSPEALFLDEPTNGVDPISRREFWDLLYRLQERKILIIVTTAYMDEAERCSEVHLMHAGRVLASGEPKALLAREGARNFEEVFLRREAAL